MIGSTVHLANTVVKELYDLIVRNGGRTVQADARTDLCLDRLSGFIVIITIKLKASFRNHIDIYDENGMLSDKFFECVEIPW